MIVRFFICLFLILTSCSTKDPLKEKNKSNVARINIQSDPSTLDPRKSRTLNEKILTNMLFEGLIRKGKSGKNEPALAKEMTVSEDGLCYTFCLREAYWTNGDRVRAQDFIYSWKKALSPDFLSENAYQLFCIKNAREIKIGEKSVSELSVRALDDNTLQVDLVSPLAYFLELLSFSVFFPFHEEMDKDPTKWISCGPFSLEKWKHNECIEVVKNEHYWDKQAVGLEAIHLSMIEENTEMQMFKNHELDWAGSPMSCLPVDSLKELRSQKALHSTPLLGTSFFRMNTSSAPFNNANIRKAFNLAIHRQEIVENILQGGQQVALRLVPDKDSFYFQDANVEQARSFLQKGLEELGISIKEFPKITLLHSSEVRNHLISQAVQYHWKHFLGIEVALELNESKTYYSRIREGKYQIALGSWIADYEDPENFLEVFKYKKSSVNNTGWENESYTSILDAAKFLSTKERIIKLQSCEQILMEEMPIIPLYHFVSLYLKNESLKDVVLSPTGNLDFKWAYLE